MTDQPNRAEAEPLCVQFSLGPTEVCDDPAIYMDNPTGGDPLVLAAIKRVYREDLLHEALGHANLYRRATPEAAPVQGVKVRAAEAIHAYAKRKGWHPSHVTELVTEVLIALEPAEAQGWRDIETAPAEMWVIIRVADMTFPAMLMPGVSIDSDGNQCDQWLAVHEGQHPPCWSGGACWESNAEGALSMQPIAWMPLLEALLRKEGR